MLSLKVIDKHGKVLFSEKGKEQIDCIYNGEFSDGCRIRIDSTESEYIAVLFDETLKESIIYIPNQKFIYEIFKQYSGICFDEKAFVGENHRLKVRIPSDEEIYGYRNISRYIA